MLVRDLCRVYGLRSRLTKQTLMCGFAAGATHPMGGNCKAVCKADNARASSHELPPVSRRLVRDSDERRQRLEGYWYVRVRGRRAFESSVCLQCETTLVTCRAETP